MGVVGALFVPGLPSKNSWRKYVGFCCSSFYRIRYKKRDFINLVCLDMLMIVDLMAQATVVGC